MPDTKVRPIIVSNWPETPRRESFRLIDGSWQNITSPMHDDQVQDYWHARRAFLSSYHFSARSEGTSFKEKVKRSVKGLNEAAMGAFLEFRQEISRRRFGVRVYRVTVGWPASFMVRCFVPWSYNDQQHLGHEIMDDSSQKC